MRTIKNIMAVSILLLAGIGINATAQPSASQNPPAARGEHSAPLTVEEQASRNADHMKEVLQLSDKQYKKYYKLYLKTVKKMESEQNSVQGQDPGMGSGGPGMGPGGPDMGSGGPGMGPGGPGMGSGAPGTGSGGMRPRPDASNTNAERGPGGPRMEQATSNSAVMEKMDKKLRKILSEKQYNRWRLEIDERWI